MSTPADPARFQTARATLLVDRFMTSFIKIGGLAIIAAVFAIMVFIAWQVVPLFGSASVTERGVIDVPAGLTTVSIGIDEWGERPALLGADGRIVILDSDGRAPTEGRIAEAKITAASFDPLRQRFVAATPAGAVAVATVRYKSDVVEKGIRRQVSAEIDAPMLIQLTQAPAVMSQVAYANHDDHAIAAGILEPASPGGRKRAIAAVCAVETSMLGGVNQPTVESTVDLAAPLKGEPLFIMVDDHAEGVIVASDQGEVVWFHYTSAKGLVLRQQFTPFSDRQDQRIGAMGWVFGDVSIVFTAVDGQQRIHSLFVKEGADQRQWGQTRELPALSAAPTVHATSVRNKAYLQAVDQTLSLRFATTSSERWSGTVPAAVTTAVISAKYDGIAAVTADGKVRMFELNDPHPESGLRSLFGKIWYEGASAPAWKWSSSGANDDFEPKMSMMPLIFGTLKGTFYAMLFAVPIALLGAIYTSEFMHSRFKVLVKPTVEIMASLPSVVLGFLAALWLAPLIETKVPSMLCVFIAMPITALVIGWGWSRLNPAARSLIKPGWEFIVLIPIILVVVYGAWGLGPVIERMLFTVPVLGVDGQPLRDAQGAILSVADFRRWWPAVTDSPYEQRNSLVVGFMMGFAVIPIIFTIAEDALSNVPNAMRSGSLACGASRWQTAMRIVVPTASAGIFSALMIGLGRAIGETMIVVMATGNTAIMDMNIFNGMRTLSANIAVELPEAPQHSTLYRTLFLGALLLFFFTFVINTAAELLRSHLREKYKTV